MHIEVMKLLGGWYWHFKNKGRVTADAESFPTKAHAIRAAKAVVKAVIKPLPSYADPVFKTTKVDDNLFHITWS
jgi:hypothetical protein